MTNKPTKENKTEKLPIVKITPTQKVVYDNVMNQLNLKYSSVVRKSLDNLVNNLDKLLNSNCDDYTKFIENDIDWVELINSQKEMTIDYPDFEPLENLFRRRSKEGQSNDNEQEAIQSMRDNGEIDALILSVEDSSSYKELSFLKALQISLDNKLPLRIYSQTRSEIETVTRSADNMKIFVKYAQDNLMLDVTINGFNLFYDGSLLIFLAEINESKWLSNANTKLAEKHFKYKKALKTMNLDNLDPLEKKEVISLLKYNRSIDKAIKFFEYLENKFINNKKRIIKRLNEGTLSKIEKKGKLTIEELITKHADLLEKMSKRITQSRK
jgi:hypothetical protein